MTIRAVLALLAASAVCADAQDIVASVSQGTNIALALAPDGSTLVVDLMGGLWSLPVTGGGAEPLVPRIEMARNPRFSPDGRQLVYQQYARGQWDLWAIDLETRERRALTSSSANEVHPDFAPDGRSIVFASDTDGMSDIYRLMLATGNTTRLTFDGNAQWPALSGSGELAYVQQLEDRWELRVLSGLPPAATVYSSANPIASPSWRPGGGVLVFNERRASRDSVLRMVVIADIGVTKTLASGEDIFGFRAAWSSPAELIYAADGRIWRRSIGSLDREPIPMFAGVGIMAAPAGLRGQTSSDRTPRPARGIRAARTALSGEASAFTALGDLWLRDANGVLRQLTNDPFVDIDPAFSPDGTRLVFTSDRAGTMNLWLIDLMHDQVRRLTTDSRNSFEPVFSPDGQRIAYLSTSGFGPWAATELRVLTIEDPQRPVTLARNLRDASDVAWSQADSVWVWARPPGRAPLAGEAAHQRLEVELATLDRRWNDAASEPARELLADIDESTLAWTHTEGGGRYVIQADRVFDGIGTQYRRHLDIHIQDREIVAVVPRGVLPLPRTVIDAGEYTVLPGLIDMHAHQSAVAGERLGRLWLAYGVTTVREIGGQRDDGLERRESWASGRRLGPRLLLSARHGEHGGGWGAPTGSDDDPVYDVLQLSRNQPAELARELSRDARSRGIPVFGDSLYPAIELGVNAIEHIGARAGDEFDLERSSLGRSYADVLELLRQSGTAVIPTIGAFGGYRSLAETRRSFARDPAAARLFTADERARWRSAAAAPAGDDFGATLASLMRAGVRLVAGSDAPNVPYGQGLHAEIALLTRAGLSNDQALRAATSDAALALGLERQIGTIEAGRYADLVIVDGNPLVDIEQTLSIVAVVHDGIWHDREDLLGPPTP